MILFVLTIIFIHHISKQRAFDVLSHSTHLYGRPLVLEWAKDDSVNSDNVNEVRQVGAKTARYFGNSTMGK